VWRCAAAAARRRRRPHPGANFGPAPTRSLARATTPPPLSLTAAAACSAAARVCAHTPLSRSPPPFPLLAPPPFASPLVSAHGLTLFCCPTPLASAVLLLLLSLLDRHAPCVRARARRPSRRRRPHATNSVRAQSRALPRSPLFMSLEFCHFPCLVFSQKPSSFMSKNNNDSTTTHTTSSSALVLCALRVYNAERKRAESQCHPKRRPAAGPTDRTPPPPPLCVRSSSHTQRRGGRV
jgi:hypothetical protein